jgi:hypothetical protein
MHTPGRRGLPASDHDEVPPSIPKTASFGHNNFRGSDRKKEKTRTEIRIKNMRKRRIVLPKLAMEGRGMNLG